MGILAVMILLCFILLGSVHADQLAHYGFDFGPCFGFAAAALAMTFGGLGFLVLHCKAETWGWELDRRQCYTDSTTCPECGEKLGELHKCNPEKEAAYQATVHSQPPSQDGYVPPTDGGFSARRR